MGRKANAKRMQKCAQNGSANGPIVPKLNGKKLASEGPILSLGKGDRIKVPYAILERAAKTLAEKESKNPKPSQGEIESAESQITGRVRILITAFELDGKTPRFGKSMIRADSVGRKLRKNGGNDRKAGRNLISWLRQNKMLNEKGTAGDMIVALSNHVAEMAAPWGEVMGAVYKSIHTN